MAVPKRRTGKSKRDMRRSHHHLTSPATATCSNCKAPTVPHRVCSACGYYNGRFVVQVKQV
ncbi:50S ribosomal protein L32 [bacterium]|nr:50S ribosomal protein L32 [bacterium]MBU1637194.1 50S ribosomal protein L32 [bacterium]MBU1921398.1 50S ribosomal protein L32 [bacterium]